MGVMLFEFLSGQLPFKLPAWSSDTYELINIITKGKYQFNEDWEYVSNDAKDLVRNLLKIEPSQRYSMSEIKDHPWYTKFN